MKKVLFLYALAVTALLLCTLRHYRSENRRLEQNQTALASDLHHYIIDKTKCAGIQNQMRLFGG